jgi:hypothetical protein
MPRDGHRGRLRPDVVDPDSCGSRRQADRVGDRSSGCTETDSDVSAGPKYAARPQDDRSCSRRSVSAPRSLDPVAAVRTADPEAVPAAHRRMPRDGDPGRCRPDAVDSDSCGSGLCRRSAHPQRKCNGDQRLRDCRTPFVRGVRERPMQPAATSGVFNGRAVKMERKLHRSPTFSTRVGRVATRRRTPQLHSYE